jgi:hypothetical protein
MKRALALAFLLLAGAPAAAQAPLRVGLDDALACGGEARSPDCATALFFACAARLDEATCARVGLAEQPKIVERPTPLEFLVERVGTIREADVTEDTRHLAWFRAGFRLVEAQMRRCPPAGSCEGEAWDDWQVYLREAEGQFLVVYWRGDSEPDTPPEIPDAFRAPQAPPPDAPPPG